MRIIVFFDLPVETAEERKNYRKFRKFLIKNGFLMVQESVYAKLALNQTHAEQIVSEIKKAKPLKGLVHILMITEKQFAKMELICGKVVTDVINTDERLLFL